QVTLLTRQEIQNLFEEFLKNVIRPESDIYSKDEQTQDRGRLTQGQLNKDRSRSQDRLSQSRSRSQDRLSQSRSRSQDRLS
ncbi:1984_t:CDS:1, partial [Dentiscutata erythropus]